MPATSITQLLLALLEFLAWALIYGAAVVLAVAFIGGFCAAVELLAHRAIDWFRS